MRALAASLLLVAVPAWAGTQLTGGSSPDVPWARLAMSFVLCILVAAAAIVALKRYQAGGRSGPFAAILGFRRAEDGPAIRLIETRRISAHADLCLIEFDGRRMLLAASAHGIEVLEKDRAGDEGGVP